MPRNRRFATVEKSYITDIERERCKKVAAAYAELYELESILVLDVGRYGFVKLQYYTPEYGFNDVITYTDSESMFEDLWQEWLDTRLYLFAKGTPMLEMGYEEIFKCLPEEKQKELLEQKAVFAKMKKTCIFLNLGRGPIVDEQALYNALVRNQIAAAGLDVLCEEPMSADNPLVQFKDSKRLLITPHIAWASVEARTRCVQGVYENIKAFMRGENRNVVNL